MPQNKWLNLGTLLNAVQGLWNPFNTISVCLFILRFRFCLRQLSQLLHKIGIWWTVLTEQQTCNEEQKYFWIKKIVFNPNVENFDSPLKIKFWGKVNKDYTVSNEEPAFTVNSRIDERTRTEGFVKSFPFKILLCIFFVLEGCCSNLLNDY